jgi:hypothetical protein
MSKVIHFLCAGLFMAGVSSVVDAQTPPTTPTMIRRVVTGNSPQGRSYVVSDEQVRAAGTLSLFRTSAPEPLGVKAGGDARVLPSEAFNFDLTAGATGLHLFELPPSSPAQPFWHRTTTIDYIMVTSGTIVLMLDDGEVTLHPGDVAIQRNTRHAWRNPSTTVGATAWIVVGALVSPEPAPQK